MAKQDIKLAKLFVLQLAIILAPSSSLAALTVEDMTIVAGDLGTIIGHSGLTPNSVDYIKFLGIPYANHTRFLPSTLRTGPLNETGEPYVASAPSLNCHQPNALQPMTLDCLSINVWTRKVNNGSDPSPNLRPVILFVHGGGFTIGNGYFFRETLIMDRDVVFVNFNYRLGVLGFFCLNNDDAPGNAGMYDVVTALDWVQRYIVHFGGDPNSVTLAGQSAGAVAVTLMMVSPLATGKFHRAIANSGSVLNEWGSSADVKTSSLLMASYCNCTGTDQEIHTCMMDADPMCLVRELDRYQIAERFEGRIGFDPITPVIQNFPLTTVLKLLESDPNNLFNEGNFEKVPLMMGATRHDGSYVMGMNYKSFLVPNNLTTDINFMRNDLVPKLLQALGIIDGSFGIYESLAKTYIGDARLTGDFDLMLPGLMDLHNVFFFKAAAYRTAVLHSKAGNNDTYWYSFDYVGRQTMWPFLFAFQPPYFPGGIAHTDDLLYVFPFIATPNEPEAAVINRMLDYWANFAEFGNPTPTESSLTIWPSLDTDENKFLSINNDSLVMENYPDAWVDASLELFPELLPTEPSVETTTAETPESTTDRQIVECSTGGGDNILVLPVTLTIAFSVISQLLSTINTC